MSASSSLSSEPEISSGRSYKETYESVKKHPAGSAVTAKPRTKNDDKKPAKKGSLSANSRINKLIEAESSSKNLNRAPSLPSYLPVETEEVLDEETEFSMSKLIRQASLNSSTTALSKTKVVTPSITLAADTDQASSSKLEQEKINKADELEKIVNTIPKPPQVFRHQLRTQKSLNDLKLEELKSVKDMAAKKSTDDIKVQIKFWAKAVASNVLQEGS